MQSTRSTTAIAAGAIAVVMVVAAACSSDNNGVSGPGNTPPSTRAPLGSVSCGVGKAVFTVSPVALPDYFGWVPLGNMNPPGHTFPTDHQYLYVNNPESSAPRREVNLYAPADMFITKGHLGTTNGSPDYTLEFSPCQELYGQFGHVLTIAPALLARLGAFDQFCNTYSPNAGSTVSTCESKAVAVKVSAGELIGTAGGATPHSFGLDVSLWDSRVPAQVYANPARWNSSSDKFDAFHIVAASDYFAEPASSQIASRLGSFDGKTRRTAMPIGGTTAYDVAGTVMGTWFNPTLPTYPEAVHLAIVPDNVDPTRMNFSIGTSLAGWSRGLVFFTPVNSGFVNRHPTQVTADGNIYCYEQPGAWVLLVKMLDASTLRLDSEPQSVTTCAAAQPWTFSAAAFDYKR